MAFKEVVESGEELPVKLQRTYRDSPELLLLMKLCRALNNRNTKDEFFLGQKDVGDLFNVSSQHGGSWLRALMRDGVIERLRKGSTNSGNSIYKYLFIGEEKC